MSGSGLRRGMEEAVERDLRAIRLTSSIICILVRQIAPLGARQVVGQTPSQELRLPLFLKVSHHNNATAKDAIHYTSVCWGVGH